MSRAELAHICATGAIPVNADPIISLKICYVGIHRLKWYSVTGTWFSDISTSSIISSLPSFLLYTPEVRPKSIFGGQRGVRSTPCARYSILCRLCDAIGDDFGENVFLPFEGIPKSKVALWRSERASETITCLNLPYIRARYKMYIRRFSECGFNVFQRRSSSR